MNNNNLKDIMAFQFELATKLEQASYRGDWDLVDKIFEEHTINPDD